MFPEAKPRETSSISGPQNILFPSVSVNKCMLIVSTVLFFLSKRLGTRLSDGGYLLKFFTESV